MKAYGYITKTKDTYEFGFLPMIVLSKNFKGEYQLFFHWLLFGFEINF